MHCYVYGLTGTDEDGIQMYSEGGMALHSHSFITLWLRFCFFCLTYIVRRLFLPCNRLGTAGGKAVAAMLLSNRALLCLDISNNCLGATGIEAIAIAVTKNT